MAPHSYEFWKATLISIPADVVVPTVIFPDIPDIRGFVVALAPVVLSGCASDPAGPEPDDFAVLFIGNSLTYTHDLPGMLEGLFELGGAGPVFVDMVAEPNWGLEDHWRTASTVRMIEEGHWDVVVLQQGPSATEGRPSLLAYGELFGDVVREAGGVPALYMVWPSLQRFFDFDGVSDSYATAAARAGGLLFPVGEAWRAAWARDPGVDLYGVDGFHPSVLGTYLAGLVMYEQLSGRDPRSLPPRIPRGSGTSEISEGSARILQEAAAEANARFATAVSVPR